MMHTLINRTLISIAGLDSISFLQGLVTNDIASLKDGELKYAYFLTPQGRIYTDVFVSKVNDTLYLDIPKSAKDELLTKFKLYKLKSDVIFSETQLNVTLADKGFADPRDPLLPKRIYSEHTYSNEGLLSLYHNIRFDHLIPDECDIIQKQSLPIEFDAERIHAVDFNKGCYVGQELTARMKYRANERYSLAHIKYNATIEKGIEITQNDQKVGIVLGSYNTDALALIKKAELLQGESMIANAHEIQLIKIL